MEWQPIETAPKDGTLVLLWIPDGGWLSWERDGDGHNNITIGSYTATTFQSANWYSAETYTEFYDYGGYTGAGTSTYQVECNPTHWMPLPPPPE